MRVAVVTLFPEMFDAVTSYGITARAIRNGVVSLSLYNPRQYARDRHRTVDDRPFGGGPGMLMKVEPLARAIAQARVALAGPCRVVYLSPQGEPLTQGRLEAGLGGSLVLIAGRYEGIDERLLETEIDEEWSIGDYVLSGGELAAMVVIDALTRLLPGALGDEESARQESFTSGLLDHPQYTRPRALAGREVPAVLLSGDHEAIRRWRLKQALGRTWRRRPDLLAKRALTDEEQALLGEYRSEREERG